jgi:hypothetical protein
LVKSLFYITSLTVLSCSNPTKPSGIQFHSDTSGHFLGREQIDKSRYNTTKDTLLLITETRDTLRYSKKEFNDIVDTHPELYGDNVQDPDPTYYCGADKTGFNSEAGQDEYYILYAYFLKKKNGVDKYADRRQKLITVFSNINSLYQHFQHGGTYFGHQGPRILGYVEFSIYLYKSYEGELSRTYDIAKQKGVYIQSLRQLVDDEIQNDNEMAEQEKTGRKKELNVIVDRIDKMITDNFDLRRAQEFQYEHYQYY